jgi:hypothetical protein
VEEYKLFENQGLRKSVKLEDFMAVRMIFFSVLASYALKMEKVCLCETVASTNESTRLQMSKDQHH